MDSLTLLSALSQIQDIQEFRLRDFMSKMGLDERQPSAFYRELLKESRDAIRYIRDLQNIMTTAEKAKSKMETTISSQQRQIADHTSLENKYRQRIHELESENDLLKGITSQLRERAKNYDGIKEFLRGRTNVDELAALCDLTHAIYEKALIASIGGLKHKTQEEDLKRLAPIRARLREDFMAVLQIPIDVLEQRLIEAEKLNKAFKNAFNQMYGGKE